MFVVEGQITCLAGGVGAARFLQGLIRVLPEEQLTVIVNTGDDINLFGLHISPDIDIVTYTLANIVDEKKGWGLAGDTFHCLEILKGYGYDTWFNLGDRDLATHIDRTDMLERGFTLSEITSKHCSDLGLKIKIIPMSNDKFETHIETEKDTIHFQKYFVHRGAVENVRGVYFEGAKEAEPAPKVIESILNSQAIIVCPSNPIVSIGSILNVNGVREALRQTNAKIGAISPIVGGLPIKGPADKLMKGLNLEVSATGVAKIYNDFLDVMIIDTVDEAEAEQIEALGLKVVITNTIMKSIEDKVHLAKTTLKSLC
jgi:LPPG:FO 2-phospho-L-lactate transferase